MFAAIPGSKHTKTSCLDQPAATNQTDPADRIRPIPTDLNGVTRKRLSVWVGRLKCIRRIASQSFDMNGLVGSGWVSQPFARVDRCRWYSQNKSLASVGSQWSVDSIRSVDSRKAVWSVEAVWSGWVNLFWSVRSI